MIKHITAALLSLSTIAAIAWGYHRFEKGREGLNGAKPNILVLSFCSLRLQHLRVYNPKAESLPALDRFLKDSLIFTNAVNGLPWTNVTNYVVPSSLRAMGYLNAKRKSLRIPLVPIHKNMPVNEINEELDFHDPKVRNYELNYTEGLAALKKAITTTKVRPFFFSVHLKYMHFPMIDEVNQKDEWRRVFSKESREALERYLAEPGRYPEKTALLLTLFADPALVENSPYARKYMEPGAGVRIGQIYQILSDAELLAAWKKSEGYTTDIRILQESYQLKLRNLDQQLAEVLDLYGREDLQKTTAIILTGDHGEALLENDIFLHANSIFDEQIRYPMAVRAAGGGNAGVIEDQYAMEMQAKLLQIVAESNADREQIADYVRSSGESIYVRNCQGTVDGLRFANRYKLVSDLNGFHLYDVAADPFHLQDLRFQEPDIFYRMKELFLEYKSRPQNLLACDTAERRGVPLHTKKNESKFQ